jgi:intein/homing endonuclease
MLSGEEIPIEQVKVGDEVLSFDTSLGVFVGAEVEALRRPKSRNLVRITFTDGSSITTTPDHPFYTGEGWVAVNPGTACKHVADPRAIGFGCEILGEFGKRTVLRIQAMGMPEEVPLYNFKIGGTHTYIAGGLVVHNK